MLALGPPLLSWRTIMHWIFKFTNLRPNKNNIYSTVKYILLKTTTKPPPSARFIKCKQSINAQICPVLGNTAKHTSQNGNQWETNEWFPRCRSRDGNASRRLWRNHSHCHWTGQRRKRWGRLRGEGRWKLGNFEAQKCRALRSRFTGYSPGPGSLVGSGSRKTTSRVQSRVKCLTV